MDSPKPIFETEACLAVPYNRWDNYFYKIFLFSDKVILAKHQPQKKFIPHQPKDIKNEEFDPYEEVPVPKIIKIIQKGTILSWLIPDFTQTLELSGNKHLTLNCSNKDFQTIVKELKKLKPKIVFEGKLTNKELNSQQKLALLAGVVLVIIILATVIGFIF